LRRSIERTEVRTSVGIDDEGNNHDHHIGFCDGAGRVCRGSKGAIGNDRLERLVKVSLARKRRFAGRYRCNGSFIDIDANHLMPGPSELHGEWKTNLPESDYTNIHRTLLYKFDQR
jgi:hypothetical protein